MRPVPGNTIPSCAVGCDGCRRFVTWPDCDASMTLLRHLWPMNSEHGCRFELHDGTYLPNWYPKPLTVLICRPAEPSFARNLRNWVSTVLGEISLSALHAEVIKSSR